MMRYLRTTESNRAGQLRTWVPEVVTARTGGVTALQASARLGEFAANDRKSNGKPVDEAAGMVDLICIKPAAPLLAREIRRVFFCPDVSSSRRGGPA